VAAVAIGEGGAADSEADGKADDVGLGVGDEGVAHPARIVTRTTMTKRRGRVGVNRSITPLRRRLAGCV
jgi:hypothetical protein